jgi:hypothetical protein
MPVRLGFEFQVSGFILHPSAKKMRRISAILILLVTSVAARASEVEFVRVWPGWRGADFFSRISEYFTDQENTSGRVVVRTHPEARAGFYFLARVRHPAVGLAGAQFVLRIVTPSNPEPRTYSFPVDRPPGVDVFELGLTGPDWTSKGVHPVAWDLELVAADGRILAQRQSFLWSKPGP